MSVMKSILIGAGLSLALAQAAAAQSTTPEIGDGIAMVVTAQGTMTYLGGKATKVNATGHKMLMQHATQLKPGTVIYRSGNNFYVLDNKMIDGKMTEDHAKGWVGGY
jgi:hypothetical protein